MSRGFLVWIKIAVQEERNQHHCEAHLSCPTASLTFPRMPRRGEYSRIPESSGTGSRPTYTFEPLPLSLEHERDSPTPSRKRTYIIGGIIASLLLVTVFVTLLLTRHTIDNTTSDNETTTNVHFPTTHHPLQPTTLWGSLKAPYPTGAWWINIMFGDIGEDATGATDNAPSGVLPYGVKCSSKGLHVSYGASRRVVTPMSIVDPFNDDLVLSSTSEYKSHGALRYDNLSVTIQYELSRGKFTTYLVKGSPYVTVEYKGNTPLIKSQRKITEVSSPVVQNMEFGSFAHVTLANGQKWMVYCSETVAFVWVDDEIRTATPINGVIRVAIIPASPLTKQFSEDTLHTYAPAYPISGFFNIAYGGPNSTYAVLRHEYVKVGQGPLLMLALPHHVDMFGEFDNFVSSVDLSGTFEKSSSFQILDTFGPVYCTKGKMTGVVGDTWQLLQPLIPLEWDFDNIDKLDSELSDEIKSQLQQDIGYLVEATDPYNVGKELGRLARLGTMAYSLSVKDVRKTALDAVKKVLRHWFDGANRDKLLYDRTWGGIVPQDGIEDHNKDYGAGYYNDHHFHYGYFLQGIAFAARHDKSFYHDNRAAIDALWKDIGGMDSNDKYFPLARHKDFFDGHSWASGLFRQSNGKSQESSSEAANAYHALALLGDAIDNRLLSQWGQLLLSLEVRATKKYWHMPNSTVYDSVFAANTMAGVVGSLDVTSSTWFGHNYIYVHGINIMPITPVTAVLMDAAYVRVQYPVLASGEEGDDTFWNAVKYADHAIVDRKAALSEIRTVATFGNGNSKSNTLLFAATRPDLGPFKKKPAPPDFEGSVEEACAANTACDAAGLVGMCCPVEDSIFLGCCPNTQLLIPK